jgi:hypothetical protein
MTASFSCIRDVGSSEDKEPGWRGESAVAGMLVSFFLTLIGARSD